MISADGLAAALADRYRIERELGAGRMATVYLTPDVKSPSQSWDQSSIRNHETAFGRVIVQALRRAHTVLASAGLLAASAPVARTQGPPTVPKGENLQVVDTAFRPSVRSRTYKTGSGPIVTVDEAHHNFHTIDGRYRPFANLLEADGFTVRPGRAPFSAASLKATDVLVIANSLDERNLGVPNWRLPSYSAFDSSEIAATAAWIRQGGSLLLIADHMPFAGAAAALAAALGIQFANGYALLGTADPRTGDYPITFRRRDGSLAEHPIATGRSADDHVDSIVSFTGSAFRVTSPSARALMTLPKGTRLELPIVAWQFSDTTPRISGEGWLQGATMTFGRGRVAVFGEAAMFSAQRKGAQQVPMGMNAPDATQNPQFVLNVLHWLANRP